MNKFGRPPKIPARKLWPVQDAKARFSELLDTAIESGPQVISRRGEEVAVLVPIAEWRRVTAPHRPSLKEWLLDPNRPRDDEFADIVNNLRKKKYRHRPALSFD